MVDGSLFTINSEVFYSFENPNHNTSHNSINNQTWDMGSKGQGVAPKISAPPREAESVIVVIDGNRNKHNVDAMDWALKHVVRRGDSVIALGVIGGFGMKNTCFPFYMGVGFSGIRERLEFSTLRQEIRPKVLGEEIERKKLQYQNNLQPFYRKCKKNEVNLEIKLTFGCCPLKITVEQARSSNPRWVVLDSNWKKYKSIIYSQVGCSIAVMKGNDLATLIPSRNRQAGTSSDVSCSNQSELNVTDEGESPPSASASRQSSESAGESSGWCPLSWRIGFPRAFSQTDLEVMTNGFSKDNIVPHGPDDIRIYEGIFQQTPVLIRSFVEDDERFLTALTILSRIRHRNIMNLVGYCCYGNSTFLLFDNPCMGSLEINLQVDDLARKLSWKARWNIALEVGGSLHYLHEECATDGAIVHLSVCSSHVSLCYGSITMAVPLLENRCIDAVLDPRVDEEETNDRRMIEKLVNAALVCLNSSNAGHQICMSQENGIHWFDPVIFGGSSSFVILIHLKTWNLEVESSKLLPPPPAVALNQRSNSSRQRWMESGGRSEEQIMDVRNNEVQFAGEIQPRGCCYYLNVKPGNQKALDRQVVKSESATIKIPELDFEIPPEAQRGSLSTVEGILVRAADGLEALQEERRKVNPQTAEALDQFLIKLRACATGDSSFTFILDDPTGNSFIENPFAPSPDPALNIKFYDRTPEQQASLGYLANPTQPVTSVEAAETDVNPQTLAPHGSVGAVAGHRAIAQSSSVDIAEAMFRYTSPEEVMTFPSTCGACNVSCVTRMFVTNIPYFQEVIVMASTCDSCGYRNSELKPGGAIPEKGKKITLCVKNVKDLSRDVIKEPVFFLSMEDALRTILNIPLSAYQSDTAGVTIPEVDLELGSGTLGGMVTTVEGLITKISESLERVHGFTFGDSIDEDRKTKWQDFRSRLIKLLKFEEPWTLILDDALGNSFIAPATDELKDDHQLTHEEYERSFEQNEELGLNDLDTSSADAAYNDSTGAVTADVKDDAGRMEGLEIHRRHKSTDFHHRQLANPIHPPSLAPPAQSIHSRRLLSQSIVRRPGASTIDRTPSQCTSSYRMATTIHPFQD
ncbi:Zinc finger protein ZPR1 homolog [Linum grandiflorum]